LSTIGKANADATDSAISIADSYTLNPKILYLDSSVKRIIIDASDACATIATTSSEGR
jgi:hypothetical protein